MRYRFEILYYSEIFRIFEYEPNMSYRFDIIRKKYSQSLVFSKIDRTISNYIRILSRFLNRFEPIRIDSIRFKVYLYSFSCTGCSIIY